jgi:tetratricopeptide (TPR) repeat protein
LRAALDWAFSPVDGDISIGIALTVAAAPLWMCLSLIDEWRVRVAQGFAALGTVASADARLEMKLQAALQAALGASYAWAGCDVVEIESAWTKALDLSRRLGDVDHQLRALWGLWLIHDRQALAFARQFAAIASTPADKLVSDRMIALSYYYQGNQSDARRYIERVVANDATPNSGSGIIRFHADQQPIDMGILARILWLQGLADQAMRMIERMVERPKADDHANSLCRALAVCACPVVMWLGHLDRAEQYTELLLDASRRHALALWHAIGRAHRGVLLINRGDPRTGLPLLLTASEECRAVSAGYRVLVFVADQAAAIGRAGQTSEALATVEQDLDRTERSAEGWIIPELLRVKGELLRSTGTPGTAGLAEACFQEALQLAGRQNALAWELRTGTSLARLLRDQGRPADAIGCLQPIYDRFTEGFGTADLIAAKQLLDDLAAAGHR